MFANTMFSRAAQAVGKTRRESALRDFEMSLDALAKARSLTMLGCEHEDAVAVIREMRSNFDLAIRTYLQYGRQYLPFLPNSMSPMMSWFLVFMYIAMTRGGVMYMLLPAIVQRIAKETQSVLTISNMCLEFTHDHTLWNNSEAFFERMMLLSGMQYQPVHMFDNGDDVLMVANLVGLHKGYRRSVICFPIRFANHEDEEYCRNSFPPMVAALLSEDDLDQMQRAYFMNVNSFDLERTDYMTVALSKEKIVEVMRAMLIAHECLRADEADPMTLVDIQDMIDFLRDLRLKPIPGLRDQKLCDRIKKRFGFSLFNEQNSATKNQVFNIVTLMSITLATPDHSPLLH